MQKQKFFSALPLLFLILLPLLPAHAQEYPFGPDATVIGTLRTYRITNEKESLIELAREFGVGYNEIVDANPDLDPFIPGAPVTVTIPSAWILPEMKTYEGLVINLSEMRLYYFYTKRNEHLAMTFPIGIGSEGHATPVGNFSIVQKTVNPSWYVPESIKREYPELPDVVPPGPDNPLGTHALRLSLRSILIHGTNRPFAIGRRASHGCIRLYPEDIPKLFDAVPSGTPIAIVRQPIKLGMRKGRIHIEVHYEEESETNYFIEAMQLLKKKDLFDAIDVEKLYRALSERKGIPADISKEGE
ncbi:MAG: L,D-transpeptidase family protein [Alphaproteobacteria bacterium]|uniref:L,D-transpeptidase family protein n=1 Tax=Candidatus Nitrobium versatile TaxID=2884831 RepID=A0A953M2X2_9BACT|nr:L,D-transpeptidase family protein [Candidatus Nitrobium versatile]